jgi:hypothetical protein
MNDGPQERRWIIRDHCPDGGSEERLADGTDKRSQAIQWLPASGNMKISFQDAWMQLAFSMMAE